MIECSNEFIFRKRKKKRWLFIVIFLTIICLSFFYYKNLTKYVGIICSDKIGAIATSSTNKAVAISLSNTTNYSDFVVVEKNDLGDIVLLSASSYKINKITNEIIANTNMIMADIIAKGIPIPSLAFSGIPILSGYGKDVYFRSINIVSTTGKFKSNFKSVGINQTLHSIYVEVVVSYSIDFPLFKLHNQSVTQVLISENVLIGKIPNTYLNADIFK